MVPLQDKEKKIFALPCGVIQYTITRFPHGYNPSPVTAYAVLAEFLQKEGLTPSRCKILSRW